MPSPTLEAVIAALKECGPMSTQEISEYLDWTRKRVFSAISRARIKHPGQLIRIARYLTGKTREIPVYTAGKGVDVVRPDYKSKDYVRSRRRDYTDRCRALLRVGSIRRTGARAASPWDGLFASTKRKNGMHAKETP